jgi:hypothetical protein
MFCEAMKAEIQLQFKHFVSYPAHPPSASSYEAVATISSITRQKILQYRNCMPE